MYPSLSQPCARSGAHRQSPVAHSRDPHPRQPADTAPVSSAPRPEPPVPYASRMLSLFPVAIPGAPVPTKPLARPFTCGAPTSSTKRPCKQPVVVDGQRCKCHAAPALLAGRTRGSASSSDGSGSSDDASAGGSAPGRRRQQAGRGGAWSPTPAGVASLSQAGRQQCRQLSASSSSSSAVKRTSVAGSRRGGE